MTAAGIIECACDRHAGLPRAVDAEADQADRVLRKFRVFSAVFPGDLIKDGFQNGIADGT